MSRIRTPIEETLAALTEVVAEGKVRYIGSSNLAGWEVVDADWTSRTGGFEAFISAQNEYSWLNRSVETELVPALEHTGQSMLPYFPLASGLLTGEVPARGARSYRQPAGPESGPVGQGELRRDRSDPGVRGRAGCLMQVAIGGLAVPTRLGDCRGHVGRAGRPECLPQSLWVPSGDDLEALLEITKPAVPRH